MTVQLGRLLKRDRHMCWICGHPVQFDRGTDLAMTRDHVPELRQGAGLKRRIYLAHQLCNNSRSNGGLHPPKPFHELPWSRYIGLMIAVHQRYNRYPIKADLLRIDVLLNNQPQIEGYQEGRDG